MNGFSIVEVIYGGVDDGCWIEIEFQRPAIHHKCLAVDDDEKEEDNLISHRYRISISIAAVLQ